MLLPNKATLAFVLSRRGPATEAVEDVRAHSAEVCTASEFKLVLGLLLSSCELAGGGATRTVSAS